MATIRATLHHGDFREVTYRRLASDTATPADVARALAATAYGSSLHYASPEAQTIADELNAGTPTGRGWVHLDMIEGQV